MAEIHIDTYLCSGCGACVELCPQVFQINSMTDKAELVDDTSGLINEDVYQAAAYCPEKCIEIIE